MVRDEHEHVVVAPRWASRARRSGTAAEVERRVASSASSRAAAASGSGSAETSKTTSRSSAVGSIDLHRLAVDDVEAGPRISCPPDQLVGCPSSLGQRRRSARNGTLRRSTSTATWSLSLRPTRVPTPLLSRVLPGGTEEADAGESVHLRAGRVERQDVVGHERRAGRDELQGDRRLSCPGRPDEGQRAAVELHRARVKQIETLDGRGEREDLAVEQSLPPLRPLRQRAASCRPS